MRACGSRRRCRPSARTAPGIARRSGGVMACDAAPPAVLSSRRPAPRRCCQRRHRRPSSSSTEQARAVRPARPDGAVDEVQQSRLGAGFYTRGHVGGHAPTLFSLQQGDLDGHLLGASPSGPPRLGPSPTPGRRRPSASRDETANASRAPRLATSRARMIVERSTPQWSAHSTTVISPVSTCTNASYFCTGDNRRLPRRPLRSKGLEVSVVAGHLTLLSQRHAPTPTLRNQRPETGHDPRTITQASQAPLAKNRPEGQRLSPEPSLRSLMASSTVAWPRW